jgi:hypothetical protein
MIEARLRTRIHPKELEQKVGKVLTDKDYNVLLTGKTKILKPDGKPLAVYLPGAVLSEMDQAYPTLQAIKMKSDNRGLASGSKRVNAGGNRTRAMPVHSGILGAMDPAPNRQYCRLTHYTRSHTDKWEATWPLLERIAALFQEHVPDRFAAQSARARNTHTEWIVPNTPFTTITINNTYSTGVHTDKGDLDEGFSCLAVGRRGAWSGGRLTFPEYRVAVDMRHGDLILMDAHEWHGNTTITCECGNVLSAGPCTICSSERISVVCYYRTEMAKCESMSQEDAKRSAWAEARASKSAA